MTKGQGSRACSVERPREFLRRLADSSASVDSTPQGFVSGWRVIPRYPVGGRSGCRRRRQCRPRGGEALFVILQSKRPRCRKELERAGWLWLPNIDEGWDFHREQAVGLEKRNSQSIVKVQCVTQVEQVRCLPCAKATVVGDLDARTGDGIGGRHRSLCQGAPQRVDEPDKVRELMQCFRVKSTDKFEGSASLLVGPVLGAILRGRFK